MTFTDRIYDTVQNILEGRVATYGQIAALAGSPGAARVVGHALRVLTIEEKQIPWWHVINSKVYISINQSKGGVEKEIQRDLLVNEGVEVSEKFMVDLERYLWRS